MRVPVKWEEKIAPSRKCASYRNEVIDAYHRHQPALVDATAQCVSDSGGLATKSSQNFGSIESDLRSNAQTSPRTPIAETGTHAGIVKVKRFAFEMP